MIPKTVLTAALAVAVVAIALTSDSFRSPTPTTSPDSIRVMRDLSILAHDSMGGRAPGTPGSLKTIAYLAAELERAGVVPMRDGFERPFVWERGSGVNLVGHVLGDSDQGVVLLTAHFDHVGTIDGVVHNGADDNASGTVAALEIARLLSAAPLRSTFVVALLDAEESGLQGARAFVRDSPTPLDGISLVVNLDMVSRSDGVLWVSGAYHTPSLRPTLEAVAASAPVTLRLGHDRTGIPGEADWTNSSDHGPFHAAGVPFVYFGVEDHPDYHKPTDDVERVDAGDYLDSIRTILAALRALDAALPFLDPAPSR
ncbi:MAG: M28 family peptidase [Gemmatimonadetes bacterium]|nr:M28 family peptidase [Gemmatimonadota bacterium]MDA1102380.1 M28 family peptidase [Gemmatimonadota bacterium]